LFGAGISQTNVTFKRDYDDLVISINGTTDSLRVYSYFQNESATSYTVENIKFADGTLLKPTDINAIIYTPTSGDDILYGDAYANTIHAGDGNDAVYGRGGNDILDGGNGNDSLSGEDITDCP